MPQNLPASNCLIMHIVPLCGGNKLLVQQCNTVMVGYGSKQTLTLSKIKTLVSQNLKAKCIYKK